MPLQAHICLLSPPPPCCQPAQAGSDSAPTRDGVAVLRSSQSCPWWSEESEGKNSVYSCLSRGENSCNQYYSGTNGNVIFSGSSLVKSEMQQLPRSKFKASATMAGTILSTQSSISFVPCSALGVCDGVCNALCLWSAAEEEMQSPDMQSCLVRKRPVQSVKCWVLSISSATSRNQGHSSGPHRLRLLRRNFLLCCFWNI